MVWRLPGDRPASEQRTSLDYLERSKPECASRWADREGC